MAALVDARRGFGQHSTMFALEWAMARARQQGVAMVVVRHSTHIGRLGEYAERTAAEGLIGIVTVGAVGAGIGGVVPVRGPDALSGDQSVGPARCPAAAGHLIFYAATSTLAEGKVRVARAAGKPLPPDAILDRTAGRRAMRRPSTRGGAPAARGRRPGTRATASGSPPGCSAPSG